MTGLKNIVSDTLKDEYSTSLLSDSNKKAENFKSPAFIL